MYYVDSSTVKSNAVHSWTEGPFTTEFPFAFAHPDP